MKRVLALCSVAAILAGCQTASIDATIQETLPEICDAATAAHAAFTVYAEAGVVSASVVERETLAWNALQPVCVDPERQTAMSILVAASSSLLVITTALQNAE